MCIVGSDKGNLNYIRNLINEKKLDNQIHLGEYLSDEEIVYLYKNCYAVIVPTLVGSISFPVIEGFYFQKPVLCSLENLDEEYKKYVFPLNLKNPASLETAINFIKSDKEEIRLKILDAKSFFDKKYDDNKLSEQYVKMIKEFSYYNSMWKQ